MTPLHADIIRTIEQHGPITSEDIAERLTELGYGGGTCFDEFKRQVSKIASKLKATGKVIGDDIPQAKAKPMRVYRMEKAEEMASDMADSDMVAALDALDTEREIQERQSVADTSETFKDTWTTPRGVEFNAAVKQTPISVPQALAGFEGFPHELVAFMRGIEFSEKYHGISQ